jgi:hypothetical protein
VEIIFRQKLLQAFWINIRSEYSSLNEKTLKLLVLFSSTYLYDAGFPAMILIKTKERNRLCLDACM